MNETQSYKYSELPIPTWYECMVMHVTDSTAQLLTDEGREIIIDKPKWVDEPGDTVYVSGYLNHSTGFRFKVCAIQKTKPQW